jgi:hypothetical protein
MKRSRDVAFHKPRDDYDDNEIGVISKPPGPLKNPNGPGNTAMHQTLFISSSEQAKLQNAYPQPTIQQEQIQAREATPV